VTSATGTLTAAGERKSFFQRIDPRWYSSSLLTAILVIGQWKFQILGDSYVPWLLSLGTAMLVELVLWRALRDGWPNLLSAYISGNSVAILVKPQGDVVWPFVAGAALSIASKYVLTRERRHLWNPTNFGVCALLLLAGDRVAMLSHQWGNALGLVAILWGIGLFTVWRARVLHLTLSYAASFVALAALRAWLLPGGRFETEVSPITGPMYTLFMFFMITDPKTLVRGRVQQIAVVIAVAVVECALRLMADFDVIPARNPLSVAPPMYALFVVGPACLWWQLRRTSDAHQPASRRSRSSN
jgi:hypothetical protein